MEESLEVVPENTSVDTDLNWYKPDKSATI